MNPSGRLRSGDALLLVDVQIDFCPGGRLPIERGDDVVPVLNAWIAAAHAAGVPVFASPDWHPREHLSFAGHGGKWPVHCVQDSEGARFHPDLRLPEDTIVVTKGTRFDQDQYSAFDQTGLAQEFRRRGIERVWIGGLAQDVCVMSSALDAAREGFETHVIEEGTRPVSAVDGRAALTRMREAGVLIDA